MSLFLFPSADPAALALDDGFRQRTWAELDGAVRSVAVLLADRGLGQGARIALLSRNRVEYIEWLLGALCAGVWVTPVNWHLQPREIDHVVRDSGAALLVLDPDLADPGCAPASVAIDAVPCRPAPLDGSAAAGGLMLYTSGTTGLPKGVRRASPVSLDALLQRYRDTGHAVGMDGRGPHLVTGPLYHAAPLFFALYDLLNGATLRIMRQFDAATALELIERHRVRHTHWVPTLFVRALRLEPSQRHRDLSSLSRVLHGAAPVSPGIKQAMIDWWGPVLVEYWGGSESGTVTLIDSVEWQRHRGSVGRPLPAFEVYAVDSVGERLPAGEVGELVIVPRSGERIFHYHGDNAKTERAHIAGHGFTLGDLGRVDAEGYVYLVDRSSHTIISGGVNIYPAEVEAVLCTHPEVADVAVIGEADLEWGERVLAVVEPVAVARDDASLSARLDRYAHEQLAGFKCPRRYEIVASLPRADSGKLYVRRLRERLAQRDASSDEAS